MHLILSRSQLLLILILLILQETGESLVQLGFSHLGCVWVGTAQNNSEHIACVQEDAGEKKEEDPDYFLAESEVAAEAQAALGTDGSHACFFVARFLSKLPLFFVLHCFFHTTISTSIVTCM